MVVDVKKERLAPPKVVVERHELVPDLSSCGDRGTDLEELVVVDGQHHMSFSRWISKEPEVPESDTELLPSRNVPKEWLSEGGIGAYVGLDFEDTRLNAPASRAAELAFGAMIGEGVVDGVEGFEGIEGDDGACWRRVFAAQHQGDESNN